MSFEFLSRIGLMILFGTILVIHAAFISSVFIRLPSALRLKFTDNIAQMNF